MLQAGGYRYIIDWNTKVTLSRILYIRKALANNEDSQLYLI